LPCQALAQLVTDQGLYLPVTLSTEETMPTGLAVGKLFQVTEPSAQAPVTK